MIDLDNISRRNNLVLFGYPEEDKEDCGTLQEKITKDVLENKLGVSIM